jgi:hypothetical protein
MGRPKIVPTKGEIMPLYFVANQIADNFDPSTVTEAMVRDINTLNEEAEAAGVRVFAGGLQPTVMAKSLRAQPNGDVLITDGPYLEAKEHVGGFWLMECADMDEALAWGRKGATVGQVPGEVHDFFRMEIRQVLQVPEDSPAEVRRRWIHPGEGMVLHMVAIHHPDNYDPSTEGEAMIRDIDTLNEEMEAAGVRVFAGGLEPSAKAKSLRAKPNGDVLITDGPYLETKEHVGGFWLLEAADMDKALEWGRKAVVACRAPVEVRQFFQMPEDSAAGVRRRRLQATEL